MHRCGIIIKGPWFEEPPLYTTFDGNSRALKKVAVALADRQPEIVELDIRGLEVVK
jgi:hypothetical protein|tara:strand:- start:236 stop:403 length:168 start_codon:yes stop_codon:yes gene_type:complete